ncbi:hypothetical protein [Paenibacillus eucommiae]|uniref:Uncharacterized protein n=1 Tax=Paenibacillus eucommiae TaxID=1355755 RepID=A0ABS4J778_9BACL|nr:hypothetical protein [Paenibacillus eucommiae]MBP1995673.1 hypothetical protein [Paenibacillus eucommiae]
MKAMNIQWFIAQEKDRTLINVENGTIGKEQATGSLSTLYQIAAEIDDKECMKDISSTIALLRHMKSDPRAGGFEMKRTPIEQLGLVNRRS